MKMFLTGEGPTDCGRNRFDKKSSRFVWEDGPVQVYIRKIIPDLQIDTFGKAELRDLSATRKTKRNQRSTQGLEGHGQRAFYIAQLATEKGYDIAAMYSDADKSSGSTQKDMVSCQRRYDLISGQILAGLRRGGADKPLAIVPMKMIECWILGDREAFVKIFGSAPKQALFKDPELLWGDEHDPESGYPKNRLARILRECGEKSSQDTFVTIANASDITTLCKSCPISFADFFSQLNTYACKRDSKSEPLRRKTLTKD